MFTQLLLAGLLSALAFFLRILPRLRCKRSICHDSYLHLSIADQIRENNHRIPDCFSRTYFSSRFSYPFFYHWLISWFSRNNAERFERFSSPLIDAAHTFLVWWMAYGFAQYVPFATSPIQVAFWSALLFAIAPALLRVHHGPRAYHGTPRPFSQLLFSGYMACCLFYALTGEWPWILGGIVFVLLSSITSKFANQAIILTAIPLIASGEYFLAYLIPLGFLGALLLTRGKAYWIWKGHLLMSSFYYRRLQQQYIHRFHRTLSAYILDLLRLIRHPIAYRNWFFGEQYWRESFWLHVLVIAFPQIIVCGALYALSQTTVFETWGWTAPAWESLILPAKWILASLLLMSLTAQKPLKFIGEAERYCEMTVSLQLILFALLALTTNAMPLLYLMVAYSLLGYCFFIHRFLRIFGPDQNIYNDFLPLCKRVDKEGLLLYSPGISFWAVLYATKRCTVLCPGAHLGEDVIPLREWDMLYGNYPNPTVSIDQLADHFKIDIVLTSPQSLLQYQALTESEPFPTPAWTEIDRQGAYIAYTRKNSLDSPNRSCET